MSSSSSAEDSDTSNVRFNRRRLLKHKSNLLNESRSSSPEVASSSARPNRRVVGSEKSNRIEKGRKARFLGDDDDAEAANGMLDDLFGDLSEVPNHRRRVARPESARLEGNANSTRLDAFDDDDDPWRTTTGIGAEVNGEAGIDLVGGILPEDADDIKKARRPIAKLNDTRLLSPIGFPKLLASLGETKLKFKKGEETKDLRKVLRMYQLWCHQMYPKFNLRDNLKIIEKLCRKRTVQVSLIVANMSAVPWWCIQYHVCDRTQSSLRQYRDEYKKANQPPEQADEDQPQLDPMSSPARQARAPSMINGDELFAQFDQERSNRNEGNDEEIDFDDLFEDEDALMEQLHSAAESNTAPPVVTEKTTIVDDGIPDDLDQDDWMDDEAEAAMRELEA